MSCIASLLHARFADASWLRGCLRGVQERCRDSETVCLAMQARPYHKVATCWSHAPAYMHAQA